MKQKRIIYQIPKYDDFKKMNFSELESLATLIREKVINLSRNKNVHLSSNLGIVELSMALLYVFNSPQDLIVYDTGHQSYVHKILTNRADQIDTIRDYGGLSGFQNPLESEHDLLSSGHSGSILSVVQGYIENLTDKSRFIISVVGDGAISNGLTLEALNNISYNKTPMLIVINDNGMSISENVGEIHEIMSKIPMSKQPIAIEKKRSKKIYWFLYKSFSKVFGFLKRKNFFEKWGFHYFGVIDGNNIKKLIKTLKKIKNQIQFGPVILHVKTIKGLGLKVAETDKKGFYHSLKLEPVLKEENLFYGKAAANFLESLIIYDKNIHIINPAMTLSSGFLELREKYPNNYEDVGIAEEHAVSKASGILLSNKKVFVCLYSSFLQRTYDNILHDVARLKLPLVFLLDRCDLSYADGDTHHGIYDLGFLKSIPNTIICSPSNQYELEKLILLGYENKQNPFFIRYSNDLCSMPEIKKEFRFGSWLYLVRKKETKTCIISYGHIINDLYDAIKNKEIDLINAIFITNYQKDFVIKVLSSYKQVYVVEKVFDSNCLGDDLINLSYQNNLNCSIHKINIKTNEIGFGDKKTIDQKIGLDVNSIMNRIFIN